MKKKFIIIILCLLISILLITIGVKKKIDDNKKIYKNFTINYSYSSAYGTELDVQDRLVIIDSDGKVIIKLSNDKYKVEPVIYYESKNNIDKLRKLISSKELYLLDDDISTDCLDGYYEELIITNDEITKSTGGHCPSSKSYDEIVDFIKNITKENRKKLEEKIKRL